MTAAMIDTQVLSFALATESALDNKAKRIQRDCNALISGFEEIRVSAITVLELLRGPPQVVAKIRASGILPLLRTEAFDGPIAEEAARILEAARSDSKSCARCLNVTGASPCPACGQLVSHQQKRTTRSSWRPPHACTTSRCSTHATKAS